MTWQIAWQLNEQKFQMSFEGKLDGKKLTGEIAASRGTRKVTGNKIMPAAKKG